jgi:hypothetical protein
MPIAEKLVLPQGYGQTTETLAWERVRAQLEQAKQYCLPPTARTGARTWCRSTACAGQRHIRDDETPQLV